MDSKVPLKGAELQAYETKAKAEAEQKQKDKAALDRKRRLREAADSKDDDDEESSGSDTDDEAAEGAGEDDPMRDVTNGDRKRSRGAGGDAEVGSGPTAGGAESSGYVPSGGGGYLDEFAPEDSAGSFDTYVRGQFVNRSEFTLPLEGKTTESGKELVFPSLRELPRLRVFPFVEKRRKVDAYGELVDVQGWLSRGKTEADQATEAAAAAVTLGKRKREEEAVKVG